MTKRTFLILILTFAGIGCDTSEPDDVQDVLATRIDIELRESTTNETLVSTITGSDGFRAGASFHSDTLRVEPGRHYTGRLRFYNANGEEITVIYRRGAENYQLFYSLTGVESLDLVTTDVESDYGQDTFGADLKVGLTFEISTLEEAIEETGRLRINMGEFEPGIKNGSRPEEPIVDIEIPVQIKKFPEPPKDPLAPEEISKAVLTMTRSDSTLVWTVTAIDRDGLAYADDETPDSLRIEGCNDDGSGLPVCFDADAIVWTSGLYTGLWDLSNADTGQNFTTEILTEGRQHQFFYRVNFGTSNLTITDQDSAGLPVGISFQLFVPDNVGGSGGFNVQLGHFSGDTKTGSVGAQLKDLRFRIPFEVQ